ncbi:hypothetical protein [Embleya sp. NBC_00896]|uniref:hypothetical protein n=1 Tax=Embleya sp. NBC_00896 TaxID=2975961 RepID=UPI0038666263|nr:hypothetical protein OG928_35840 [Embleya sp. NBC_00896]
MIRDWEGDKVRPRERHRLLLQDILDLDLTDPPRGPRPEHRHDGDQAERLRAHSAHIVALDTRFGARDHLEQAVRSARSARRATLIGPTSRDTLAAVAEAQQIAGWMAFDADRHDLAAELTTRALVTARLAGDRSGEHFALSQLAMQAIHLRQPGVALGICDAVLEDDLPPGVRTLFLMRRARAVNQFGEHTKALDLIAETLGRHREGHHARDPAWAWWLDEAEITWHHAMIHADNRRWTRAIPLFEQSAAARAPGTRSAHYDHAHLLHALARTHAWHDVDELLHSRIAPLHPRIASPRTTNLLAHTAHLMTSHRTRTAPREAAHDLRTVLHPE